MEKLFNSISLWFGLIGGLISYFLGGDDVLIRAVVTLAVLDYITGFTKGIYTKTLSSEIGFYGLIKKIIMFIVIAAAYSIQGIIGDSIPLRDITVMFFICNEGLSLLENAATFVPIPPALKNILLQLRDKEEKK